MSLALIDPGETLAFGHDWSDWLGSDTIATSSWRAEPAGAELDGENHNTTATGVYAGGFTFGQVVQLVNTITTANGQTGERAITVRCCQR